MIVFRKAIESPCDNCSPIGRALAALGNDPDAYGETWLLPCDSNPPSGRDFIACAAEAFRVRPSRRLLGRKLLRIAGLLHPQSRETIELLYQHTEPYVVDSGKFQRRFFAATPWREGLRITARGMRMP